jgi:uncharacterized membrane protein
MGVMKPVFLPISFLIFLIPKRLFRNSLHYYSVTLSTVIFSTALTLVWIKLISLYGTGQIDVDINGDTINSAKKIAGLLKNPFIFFDILKQTVDYFHELYYKSTIGIIGYLDTTFPNGVYSIFTFLIISLAFFEADKKYKLKIIQRVILFSIAVAVLLATILAMYLATRYTTGHVAEGVQGRYFIPSLFAFFLTFYGISPLKINLSNYKFARGMLYLIILFILIVTQTVLHERYYG